MASSKLPSMASLDIKTIPTKMLQAPKRVCQTHDDPEDADYEAIIHIAVLSPNGRQAVSVFGDTQDTTPEDTEDTENTDFTVFENLNVVQRKILTALEKALNIVLDKIDIKIGVSSVLYIIVNMLTDDMTPEGVDKSKLTALPTLLLVNNILNGPTENIISGLIYKNVIPMVQIVDAVELANKKFGATRRYAELMVDELAMQLKNIEQACRLGTVSYSQTRLVQRETVADALSFISDEIFKTEEYQIYGGGQQY